MKTKFLLITILSISLFSCGKKESQPSNPIGEEQSVKLPSTIDIGIVKVNEEEIGMGCITEYHKKGENFNQLIFIQAGDKRGDGWLNFMSINGKREVFRSQHEDQLADDDGFGYTLELENERYQISIKATIGETNMESDSAEADGTITVTDKQTKERQTVQFEGGTAC